MSEGRLYVSDKEGSAYVGLGRVTGIDWALSPDYTVTQHVLPLDVLKFHLRRGISIRGGKHDSELVLRDAQSLYCDMELWIETKLASSAPETRTVSHPLDWLEALKERWAPAWFKKRWPVAHKTHTIECRLVFPDLDLPKEVGRSLRWTSIRSGVSR